MSISNHHESSEALERRLDRDFEREPTFGTRPRIPLKEGGAVRSWFSDTKPTVVQPEPEWRPADGMAVAS